MRYAVGVDLGKQADYTAISIVESVPVARTPDGRTPRPTMEVVYLKRLRGVGYPLVIAEVAAMAAWPALHGAGFAVDATGVGRPVVDALRERIAELHAVTITGGENLNNPAPREWSVPKADLVATVQLLLQSRRLRIHDHLADLETLKSELLSFGYEYTASGRMTMAAVSGHDDLVLSVAMAAWLANRDHANGATAWIDFARQQRIKPAQAGVVSLHDARTASFRRQGGDGRLVGVHLVPERLQPVEPLDF